MIPYFRLNQVQFSRFELKFSLALAQVELSNAYYYVRAQLNSLFKVGDKVRLDLVSSINSKQIHLKATSIELYITESSTFGVQHNK